MNNWWIAALEASGIWTREQAEHISNNIRNQIHSDRYVDTLASLESTLEQGKFTELPLVSKLEAEIQDLKDEVESLKASVIQKSPVKSLTSKKP